MACGACARRNHLWFATPALVALLLLVSQTSHEKSNLFQVLPLAVAVVALAMLLLPSGQTVIQPLYDKAMELRQTISDYLFFTDPRNVFTLGNYGYYPQGNARLGGPTQPSDSPVMTVKTDSRTLLRAISKDEYTGLTWRSTASQGAASMSAAVAKSPGKACFWKTCPPTWSVAQARCWMSTP